MFWCHALKKEVKTFSTNPLAHRAPTEPRPSISLLLESKLFGGVWKNSLRCEVPHCDMYWKISRDKPQRQLCREPRPNEVRSGRGVIQYYSHDFRHSIYEKHK